MRDPARIKRVLGVVQEVWERYPDLRLGQLVLNTLTKEYLYAIEDEELCVLITKFYEKAGGYGLYMRGIISKIHDACNAAYLLERLKEEE